MKATKAFYVVNKMIAENENLIEVSQEFVLNNKGNPKMRSEVETARTEIKEARDKLKPLYTIRNAFY